jgi:DNA-binding HxlR family transcriptional regulator
MPTIETPRVAALDTDAAALEAVAAANRAAAGLERTDALADALAVVGDRWSLLLVARLTAGPQRFNDLAEACAPIARTVLSDRLRKLEDADLVARKQYSDAPVRWQYRLTLAGAELATVCGVLADWSSRNLGDGSAALSHAGCGSDVRPTWTCADCGPVPAREVDAPLARA